MFTCNHSINSAHSGWELSQNLPGGQWEMVFWDQHSIRPLTSLLLHWRPPWRPLVIPGMRLTDVRYTETFFQSLFHRLSVHLSHSFTLLQTQWIRWAWAFFWVFNTPGRGANEWQRTLCEHMQPVFSGSLPLWGHRSEIKWPELPEDLYLLWTTKELDCPP